VVPEVQRLGQSTEAVRALGDTGHGQQLVHAADGQHKTIVRPRGDTTWLQGVGGTCGSRGGYRK
jgi:hypothetical protein